VEALFLEEQMKSFHLIVCPAYAGGVPSGAPDGSHGGAEHFALVLSEILQRKGARVESTNIKMHVDEASLCLSPHTFTNYLRVFEVARAVHFVAACVLRRGVFPITIGGDHSLSIGSIGASMQHFRDLGLVWVDQHPDFHTPASTETGRVHGMPLRVIMGEGYPSLLAITRRSIPPTNLVHYGATNIDSGEQESIYAYEKMGAVFALDPMRNSKAQERFIGRVRRFACTHIPVHLEFDIDVTDLHGVPNLVRNKSGISVADLDTQCLSYALRCNLVSAGVSEYCIEHDTDDTAEKVATLLAKVFLQEIS
jgi:arginase family enzyme